MDLLKSINEKVNEHDDEIQENIDFFEAQCKDLLENQQQSSVLEENSLGILLDRVESQLPKTAMNPNLAMKIARLLATLHAVRIGKIKGPSLGSIFDKASELDVEKTYQAIIKTAPNLEAAVDKLSAKFVKDLQANDGKGTKNVIKSLRNDLTQKDVDPFMRNPD